MSLYGVGWYSTKVSDRMSLATRQKNLEGTGRKHTCDFTYLCGT